MHILKFFKYNALGFGSIISFVNFYYGIQLNHFKSSKQMNFDEDRNYFDEDRNYSSQLIVNSIEYSMKSVEYSFNLAGYAFCSLFKGGVYGLTFPISIPLTLYSLKYENPRYHLCIGYSWRDYSDIPCNKSIYDKYIFKDNKNHRSV